MVLLVAGGEQVVADEAAERVQQRQGVGEAGEGAVADVHADVALGGQQRAEDLPGDRGRDLVGVEALQGHVALGLAQRGPDLLPEPDGLASVGELLRHRLAQQLGSDAQQAFGERGELAGAEAEAFRDRGGLGGGQEGADLHQVHPAADGGDLVGGQVVVHVGDVDAERLAGQEPEAVR